MFGHRYAVQARKDALIGSNKKFPVFSSLRGRNSYFSLGESPCFLTFTAKSPFSYRILTSYEFLPSKNLLKRISKLDTCYSFINVLCNGFPGFSAAKVK